MDWAHNRVSRITLGVICLFGLGGCGNGGCPGPALDVNSLLAVKQENFGQGSGGFLVIPNPIDATHNAFATAMSEQVLASGSLFHLPSLLSPYLLESSFVKVRLHTLADSLSILAHPGANGTFTFQLNDPHYSEVMAYEAALTAETYLEILGFPPVKDRPLYVMAQAQDGSSGRTDINAFFSFNADNPNLPRELQVFGNTQYAPGMDRDIYLHEFGHLNNESSSHEVGIDRAGDEGANYTEGAALHECLADYLSETIGDKPYISVWTARNLEGFQPGQPLRSAVDSPNSEITTFQTVAFADGTGASPERYHVAEWCTRVLWQIRQSFVGDDSQAGPMKSDVLMFSALGLLSQDTSISQFENALVQADQNLYCGGHSSTITGAFAQRGFTPPDPLLGPIQIQAKPVELDSQTVGFDVILTNANPKVARNVRVYLESYDPRLIPQIYMQAYGDLQPGATITIGSNGGLTSDFSVTGAFSNDNGRIPFLLRVVTENGPDGIFQGVL